MLQQCLWEGCEKPSAHPLQYCLGHFGKAVIGYYETALQQGMDLPALTHRNVDLEEKHLNAKRGKDE